MGKTTYWQRLKAHPGVGHAALLTVVFPLAGLANDHPVTGAAAGLIAATSVWLIVLITARTQPVGRASDDSEGVE